MGSGQLGRTTSLSLTNAGLAPESGRINGGSGWLSAVELGKSWQMRTGTVRQKPAQGSGAGFNRATAQRLPARQKLQRLLEILRSDSFSLCLRKSLRTGRSESPAVNWLTWSVSLGVCGRNWPGTSGARERLPSQNERVISRRNCSWSGTTKPSLNIYPLPSDR